ncbi:DUF6350 family protein [Bailinhaonella thermotolerans]|uniref:Integral membrane protein n=1 Tax=Bailinhaonella thermotolerans TaxID=1070861 RepID=A0A3A4ADG8_9ACTN|nr:DUF6350 family protein [Bailinhaonella thermotolerans]RJL23643.1 hypothetical protein D5H75_32625 [Bailinhaonella thermotolerans]
MTALIEQIRSAAGLPGESGDDEPRRPLPVSGFLAAVWTLGVGLAVLTTITLLGWIASPSGGLGPGLPGVFSTSAQLWLVAHHAGFAIKGGTVGLLPLGLAALPCWLLYRAGVWMARDAEFRRPAPQDRRAQWRLVLQGGVSLGAPYALLAGLLALIARNPLTTPSVGQALLGHFVIAFAGGAIATGRTLGPWRSIMRLLTERARSLAAGAACAVAVLLGGGFLLVVVALAANLGQAADLSSVLAPGFVGGVLLILIQLLFLPNAAIWGMSYVLGPGFAVGAGTLVAPTGVSLGGVPALPLLAALPEPGPASPWALAVLAVPFAAGIAGGVTTIRMLPTPALEAAPLWGFVVGVCAAAAAAALAALSGGPLGGGRLAEVGPSPWQVAFSAALEVGMGAAVGAGLWNWYLIRRSAGASPGKAARAATAVRRIARAGQRGGGAHWMDATEADTQPIPVVRVDPPQTRPRSDIVDESDDRGGHRIYLDPYAWDRD